MGLQLEDDLEPPSAQRRADQLVAIAISFIPSYLEVLEETLDGFVKSHPVLKKLVALEIVFEVPGREAMPIGQSSFYSLRARPFWDLGKLGCGKYCHAGRFTARR
jgi:hypothetical protein